MLHDAAMHQPEEILLCTPHSCCLGASYFIPCHDHIAHCHYNLLLRGCAQGGMCHDSWKGSQDQPAVVGVVRAAGKYV
jgi:hypothetical protein